MQLIRTSILISNQCTSLGISSCTKICNAKAVSYRPCHHTSLCIQIQLNKHHDYFRLNQMNFVNKNPGLGTVCGLDLWEFICLSVASRIQLLQNFLLVHFLFFECFLCCFFVIVHLCIFFDNFLWICTQRTSRNSQKILFTGWFEGKYHNS